jgi:hypothetical protein
MPWAARAASQAHHSKGLVSLLYVFFPMFLYPTGFCFIAVASAIFRARFVLFRTRGSCLPPRVLDGADIFIRGQNAALAVAFLLMLRTGALAQVSVFLMDVLVVAAVEKFVEIAAISAGTRDIRSTLGDAILPLRRRAIRPLIRRTGHRRAPSRWAIRWAIRWASRVATRVAGRVATRGAERLGRVS